MVLTFGVLFFLKSNLKRQKIFGETKAISNETLKGRNISHSG